MSYAKDPKISRLLRSLKHLRKRIEGEQQNWTPSGLKNPSFEEKRKNDEKQQLIRQKWIKMASKSILKKVNDARTSFIFLSLWKQQSGIISDELPDIHHIFEISPEDLSYIQNKAVQLIEKEL